MIDGTYGTGGWPRRNRSVQHILTNLIALPTKDAAGIRQAVFASTLDVIHSKETNVSLRTYGMISFVNAFALICIRSRMIQLRAMIIQNVVVVHCILAGIFVLRTVPIVLIRYSTRIRSAKRIVFQ